LTKAEDDPGRDLSHRRNISNVRNMKVQVGRRCHIEMRSESERKNGVTKQEDKKTTTGSTQPQNELVWHANCWNRSS
jgi:hypothetical protein